MSRIPDDENDGGARGLQVASGSDSVEGEINLGTEELARAVAEMPENRLKWWLVVFGAVLILVIALGSGDAAGSYKGVMMATAPLVFLAATFSFFKWQLRRNVQRSPSEGRHLRFRFDAEGFSVETTNASSSLRYAALHHFAESRTALLLYTQANFAQVLPKRAFSPADLDRVRAWLKAGVASPKPAGVSKSLVVVWVLLILAFFGIWLVLAVER